LTSATVTRTVVVAERAGLALSVAVTTRVKFVGEDSKSSTAGFATRMAPVLSIENAPLVFPLTMAKVKVWPASGSVAPVVPTSLAAGLFSATVKLKLLGGNAGDSFTSVRLIVKRADVERTGVPLSVTAIVSAKEGRVSKLSAVAVRTVISPVRELIANAL